jgi:hypothetical protein
VSTVGGEDRGDGAPFGYRDDAGVRAAEGEIVVLFDELGLRSKSASTRLPTTTSPLANERRNAASAAEPNLYRVIM